MAASTDSAGVAVCSTCSSALEVVCPNGHDAEPFEVATDDAAELRRSLAGARRENAALVKENARHAQLIDRLTRRNEELSTIAAPRSLAGDADDQPRRSPSEPRRPLTFKPKRCACGAIFTPSGGRDTRCSACKDMDKDASS